MQKNINTFCNNKWFMIKKSPYIAPIKIGFKILLECFLLYNSITVLKNN